MFLRSTGSRQLRRRKDLDWLRLVLKALLKHEYINASENILQSLWRAIRRSDELSRDETCQQAVPSQLG
jgi:hypothetical protein